MKKIRATMWKEWLVLRRDGAGLALLLLMPAVMIIVMSIIQDIPFREYQELSFELLVADEDQGNLSKELIDGLKASGIFKPVTEIDHHRITTAELRTLVRTGRYRMGIVIPAKATAQVNGIANDVLNRFAGVGFLPTGQLPGGPTIQSLFDPSVKPTIRLSVAFALDKLTTAASGKLIFGRLARYAARGDSSDNRQLTASLENAFRSIRVEEVSLEEQKTEKSLINSVQQNVPAWAIFGMFFIVVPLAGNAIRERDEKSLLRTLLIPNAIYFVGIGKIFFNVIVCWVQFFLMLLIGVYLMPLLGLHALHIGHHGFVLAFFVFFIALAATSYGYLIGTFFKTSTQALPFAAISIVILSALGGVWIPVELMPHYMRYVAQVSPLHWALEGVQQIVLRDLGFTAVIRQILCLSAFSAVLWLLIANRNRNQSQNI